MTDLAPQVAAFLREHLPRDRRASRHTIASYALTLQLLIGFAANRLTIRPCRLAIEQLTVPLILDFLESLERERGNTVRTRNLRLAAIKAFFRYIEFRVPECLDLALQVSAIPYKRFDRALVDYLDRDEVQALLNAPDTTTSNGIRDRAMLHLAYAAGLRVSELVELKRKDLGLHLETIHVMGKGRRERVLPLWKETQVALEEWLAVRPESRAGHLFLNARGEKLSRHGFARRLALHVEFVRSKMPSLAGKRVSPHVLRHYIDCMTMSCNPVRFWLYRQVSAAMAT